MRHFGADLRQITIVAAVQTQRLGPLRAADPGRYCFAPAQSWADAVELIRARPVEMAVVDPVLTGETRLREIERLRVLFPSLPILVYTALARETAAVLLALGRLGIRRALFYRFDDAPAMVREVLEQELELSASHQVLHAVSGLIQDVPDQIRWALELTLCSPAAFPTVVGLAERAQLQRRTCERWFAKRGLPSPRVVLLLARLLHAHRLLLDPGYTVEDVALKLGFGKAKSMQTHFRQVFGQTAGELRLSLSAEQALAQVAERYFGTGVEIPSQAAS